MLAWSGSFEKSGEGEEGGNAHPPPPDLAARRGQPPKPVTNPLAFPGTHYNGPSSWAVDKAGEVRNVYA